jgi:hypothetical protein
MGLAEDIAEVGRLLDAHVARVPPGVVAGRHVALEDPEDHGVPPDMQVGEVDEEGWVDWRMIPSTLRESDVAAVEREFGVAFPPLFRAYLLARHHLFDGFHSRRHDQLVSLPELPSHAPLRRLRNELKGSGPLVAAGLIAFGVWGDGWGPVCFDDHARAADGDCPVVWADHEELTTLGEERCRVRAEVQPLLEPLYGSFREMLADLFGPN